MEPVPSGYVAGMRAFRVTRVLVPLVVLAASTLGGLGAAAPVHGAPTWAPAATAAIHPGVQTFTQGAQCTANFVYTDGTNVFIGQAAHCSGTGGATDTDGCSSGTLPVGTAVDVTGASKPGVMVYNSWATMQAAGEKDANTCAYNDLALLEIDPADAGSVNPSIPAWGGPVGLNTSGTTSGDAVYSYGHSSLLLGLAQLGPRQGQSRGDTGGG